ncbi:hypothetical protein Cgig2_008231 [Carnegiea gigantea]|uniref:AP2/ERF domain-containing protein n=1 Tax=Carnegiea gigantea TaxID=171969 RepID=A0A9Q1L3D7_9CARY|nr:hypothetical protein Cgig2_008231 [Carnegiea gigantea]
MKLVMNESNNTTTTNNGSSNNSTNWLGFSLSPHHPTITCFDVAENHAGFLSPPPLAVMPLRSDGSLCIMAEALSKSHQPSQEPKLENFLGGETMALSLDSLYYNQNAAQEAVNKHHQNQYDSFFSALACQGYYQATTDCHVAADNLLVVDHGNGNGGGGEFGEVQSLSLSMSPGTQSSCVTASQISISPLISTTVEAKKRGFAQMCQGNNNDKQTVHRKSIDTFGHRTSQFRGVTNCKKEGQTRKGRQGGYDMEEKAGRAYDLAALKYWGLSTHTNFPMENYKEEIEEMKHMTRQEYVAHLRRKSSGFSRGASMYRGVTRFKSNLHDYRHHQHGRWQARIGRVAGNKDLYLGTFSTQEEAAEAYDVAAIKFRGVNAVTNFDISRYDVEKIMASNTLLAGEHAKRNKVESTEVVEQSLSTTTRNAPEWKLVSHQPSTCIESLDPKLVTIASSGNPLFSLGLRDLVALEMTSPTQPTGEDSTKLDSAHFSNSSSLVTSLNSSREGSPDKSSPSLQLASRLVGPACDWIAPVPVAQLPVFAAWGDA